MKIFQCENAEATKSLGQYLGKLLTDGDVLCFTGDLGTGKTALIKAMCAAQGVAYSDVTSPTFSLLNIYKGQSCPLKHFDLYRLNSEEELEDIGFEEVVNDGGITFIEWSELFPAALPTEYLQITLTGSGEGRQIELEPHGKHYQELCEKVQWC